MTGSDSERIEKAFIKSMKLFGVSARDVAIALDKFGKAARKAEDRINAAKGFIIV